MKIAIVEDNEIDRANLKQFIKNYATEEKLFVEIDCYSDGLELITNYNQTYDIVYFDIEMAIMDGMTAAEKLRSHDEKVIIVFVTNFIQHAIRGYSVNAADFLIKPLTSFNFQEHFKRILKSLSKREDVFISLKSNNEIHRVNLSQIVYIESQGHYLHFHLKDEVLIVLDTMKRFEEKLSDKGFFRCNNGYIVNLKYVRGLDKNMVNVGGTELQVSRPRRKSFMEALTNYVGDELS